MIVILALKFIEKMKKYAEYRLGTYFEKQGEKMILFIN